MRCRTGAVQLPGPFGGQFVGVFYTAHPVCRNEHLVDGPPDALTGGHSRMSGGAASRRLHRHRHYGCCDSERESQRRALVSRPEVLLRSGGPAHVGTFECAQGIATRSSRARTCGPGGRWWLVSRARRVEPSAHPPAQNDVVVGQASNTRNELARTHQARSVAMKCTRAKPRVASPPPLATQEVAHRLAELIVLVIESQHVTEFAASRPTTIHSSMMLSYVSNQARTQIVPYPTHTN